MTPRAWGPLLALVSLFFLLFTYLYCGNIDQDLVSTHGHHQAPGKREVSPIVKSIALPFGNEFHSPNFSVPISQLLPQQKRDLEEDRQFFWDTRCRGLQFWNQVQDVYSGRTPSAGRPITYAEVSMAWNLVEFEGDPLQRSFNEWSQDIFGRIIPEEELNTTRMDQSKDYTSVGGVERVRRRDFSISLGFFVYDSSRVCYVEEAQLSQILYRRHHHPCPLAKKTPPKQALTTIRRRQEDSSTSSTAAPPPPSSPSTSSARAANSSNNPSNPPRPTACSPP